MKQCGNCRFWDRGGFGEWHGGEFYRVCATAKTGFVAFETAPTFDSYEARDAWDVDDNTTEVYTKESFFCNNWEANNETV